MKKRFVVMAVVGVLALAILAPGAFAAATGNQDTANWFNQMFNYHQQYVNQAVQNGQLTPEQGQAWNQHFEQMRNFHSQNGYFGSGMMGNFRGGFGGMMGGFGGPAASTSSN